MRFSPLPSSSARRASSASSAGGNGARGCGMVFSSTIDPKGEPSRRPRAPSACQPATQSRRRQAPPSSTRVPAHPDRHTDLQRPKGGPYGTEVRPSGKFRHEQVTVPHRRSIRRCKSVSRSRRAEPIARVELIVRLHGGWAETCEAIPQMGCGRPHRGDAIRRSGFRTGVSLTIRP